MPALQRFTITHDLAVVAQVSDHIMVLRHGKMVEYGDTDQIINRPKEDYTKALVSGPVDPPRGKDADRYPCSAGRKRHRPLCRHGF
jgi:ABC-type glutathione transport system ATPase component